MDESKLVFIISQPRSGSTLVQKVISNNSLVDTVSEPWILLPFLSIYKPELIQAKYNYPLAIRGLFDYLKKKNSEEEFRVEFKKLLLGLYKVSNTNSLFLDKTPRYYEIASEIIDLFPKAKFLVLKRDPFASLHSMIFTWAGGKLDVVKLKTFDRDFINAPFLIQDFLEKNRSKPNVMEIQYEAFVSATENKAKEIYDWLGIPFHKDVLNIGENEKVKGIFGDDIHKKKPLKEVKEDLKDSWKKSLDNKEISAFYSDYQKYLSTEFIARYGYPIHEFNSGGSLFKKSKFNDFLALVNKPKDH